MVRFFAGVFRWTVPVPFWKRRVHRRKEIVELHEYVRYDALGLRELIVAGEVTAAEVEAVARQAIEAANAEVNGSRNRCSPVRSTTIRPGRSPGFRSC